ncbi:MAG: bile acid:sodium symporter family protein [Verrucomicrobiia bacterium]
MPTLLVVALACVSVFFMRHPKLKSFAFTTWVFTFVAASMVWPSAFGTWFGYDLAIFISPLVQIIMFGMGTKLSLDDFKRVIVMPWPVFIGILLQYTVMPVAGLMIAKLLGFPPEIAAGIILIGSVSGGVASNLIVYLSGGSVALAVTLTAVSTLMSPFMTPFLMKTLAGRMIEIDFLKMLFEILNMIVVPVVAGLVANRILYGERPWSNTARPLAVIAVVGAVLAFGVSLLPVQGLGAFGTLRTGAMVGLILIALVALAKLLVSVVAKRPNTWMDRVLPLVSMIGICVIIGIITARSRDKLLTVGAWLILAAMMHNAIGYLLGYWLSRAARLDETTARTVAVEVGMQNGGMASALAMTVLKSADAALAPAIFGPWMNISGSVLASYWRRHPVRRFTDAPGATTSPLHPIDQTTPQK